MTDVAQPLTQEAARTRTSRVAPSLRVLAAESQSQVSFAERVPTVAPRPNYASTGGKD
jgi:hypothetical protein